MLRLWKKVILCLLAVGFLFSFPVRAENEGLTYSFTSIDGKTITHETNAGKTTLIVFLHMNSNHSDAGELIQNLVRAEWSGNPNLSIIVAGCMGNTAEEVRQFVASYADENTDIAFCTDENDVFFSCMEAAGQSLSSFSIPMCFVVDENGNMQATMASEYSENSFRNLLAPYVADIDPVPMATLPVTGENVYSEAFKIVELINSQRAEAGLQPVKMDKALLDAAMLRAAECSVYYSHTRPNGTRCFTAFPSKEGSSGENIAIGQQSAEDVMDAWMNSQGHRANILNGNYNSVGIGVFCHQGIYTWVQLFSSNTAQTVKKPADTAKTAKIEVLQEHLIPRVERSLLMLKKGTEKSVCLNFVNKEFDFQYVQPDASCLRFLSSDPRVATVDKKGVVTAVAEGTALITVSLAGTDKTATIEIVVTEHNYDEWKYDAPTCAQPGSARYKCQDCGQWLDKEVLQLQAHSWDSGTVTRKPTTEKTGERLYNCTACGEIRIQSIPKYSAPKPVPTVPPTEPATKAPTNAPTNAPTAPATKAPTVPLVTQPTSAPTQAATVPATQPSITATEPTEATAMPIPEPTEMPPELLPTEPTEGITEPMESSPEFVPGTQPTQAETALSTQPEKPPAEKKDNKLTAAIIVVAVAVLAAGAFLLFWKRKK